MPTQPETRPSIRRRTYAPIAPKDEKHRTQQQQKHESDINVIMAKYQKTGALTHVSIHQQSYGFATAIDYNEAMQLTTRAEQMFADLPSSLREKFNHDPSAYLDYVQDESNYPEMAKLGLLNPEATEAHLAEPEPLPGDPEPEPTPTPTPDPGDSE